MGNEYSMGELTLTGGEVRKNSMKGQPYMIKKLQTLQFLLSLLGTDIPILLGREKVDFTVPPSLLSEILIRIGSVFSPF